MAGSSTKAWRVFVSCIAASLVLLTLGCGGTKEAEPRPPRKPLNGPPITGPSAGSGAVTKQPANASPTKPGEITVRVVDAKELDRLIAAEKGKVVLVDFWATWCGPCREQFPHTVQLHEELASQGLVAISLSNDDPDEAQGEVLEFLKQKKATFTNLVSSEGVGTKFQQAYGNTTLPFYKLYDRQGTLRYQFTGRPEGVAHGEKPDQIEKRVRELLAEK